MGPMELRDGRWPLGEAGAVDFAVREHGLELVAVEPNPGWRQKVKRRDPHRLKVELDDGTEEWELDARYQNGVLTVEVEHEIEPATAGRYQVGDAGEVEIAFTDGRIELLDSAANEGWLLRVDKQKPKDVEVEFHQGAVKWEFEAEVDGRELEVEIEGRVRGPFPPSAS